MTTGPTSNSLAGGGPLAARGAAWAAGLLDYAALGGVLAGLVVVFGASTEHFLSKTTFDMIASQVPDATIAAVGMTFVLIVAGIDLSVGSVLALGGAVLGASMVQWGYPVPAAVAACLGVGLLCGAVNGLVIVTWRLPSFIVTLGMLEVARGATMIVLDSRTAYIGSPIEPIAEARLPGLPAWLTLAAAAVVAVQLALLVRAALRRASAAGDAGQVPRPRRPLVAPALAALASAAVLAWQAAAWVRLPVPFVVALATVALGQLFLTRTVFGRHVVAVGSNEETARLCGVNVPRVRVTVFALCGLLAGLAGVMQVSRAASANPNAGAGFELDTIAAVVIGGTSLMGGRGSVVRSFLGVLIIAVLSSGLAQLGVQDPAKRVITGLVIAAAAVLDYYRQRLRRAA